MSSFVWVQLYCKQEQQGNNNDATVIKKKKKKNNNNMKPMGQPFKIKPVPKDIDDLTKAVKKIWGDWIGPAPTLQVYNGSVLGGDGADLLDPDDPLVDPITSTKNPLRIVAPANPYYFHYYNYYNPQDNNEEQQAEAEEEEEQQQQQQQHHCTIAAAAQPFHGGGGQQQQQQENDSEDDAEETLALMEQNNGGGGGNSDNAADLLMTAAPPPPQQKKRRRRSAGDVPQQILTEEEFRDWINQPWKHNLRGMIFAGENKKNEGLCLRNSGIFCKLCNRAIPNKQATPQHMSGERHRRFVNEQLNMTEYDDNNETSPIES